MGALPHEAVEVLARLAEDFEAFCYACVRIRVLGPKKRWEYVPLELTDEQREVVYTILRDEAEGRGSRIIVLKARKLGISTVVQALMYWMCSFRPGWQALTIAHIAPSTRVIARIGVDIAVHLPDLFVPYFGATQCDGGLKWSNGSLLTVQTQRSDHAARGSSPSFVHMSEVGLWDDGRVASTAEDIIVATLDALETTGEEAAAGTVAVMESTARGQQGSFYERWQRAVSGESGWTPLFFPWHLAKKHQYPLRPGDQAILDTIAAAPDAIQAWKESGVFTTSAGKFDAEAADIFAPRAVEFSLTPPQVRWYMSQWNAKSRDMAVIDQEWPLAPEHAFAASGRPVLPQSVVDTMVEPEVPAPLWCGPLPSPMPGDKRTLEARWADATSRAGRHWRIYAQPVANWRDRYVIGGDIASGGGPDASAIQVLDRVTRALVAEFHADDATPDEVAVQMAAAGYLYAGDNGPAMVVPESNNHGSATTRKLLDLGYPRIFTRQHPTAAGMSRPDAWTTIYGHETNMATRPVLLSEWRAAIVAKRLLVWSPRTKSECQTLVYDAKGRMDHVPGKRSDLVIASALALAGDRVLPVPVEVFSKKYDPNCVEDRESARRPVRQNRWFGAR